MIAVGCDVGSLYSKAVVLVDDELIAGRVVPTTGHIAEEIEGLIDAVVREAGIKADQVDCLAATGNGADLVRGARLLEDEVACVGAAAAYHLEEVELVIHVGGQSIASIKLDEDGDVADFMRNDKCASGSGRFLEMMSHKLHLDVAGIDEAVAGSARPVAISNQCGVFAESEVISHVNAGESTADILAGVCASVANIVVAQGRRFGTGRHYTVTGGVALIDSVVNIIRRKLGGAYHAFPLDARLTAAVGAALLGGGD